MKSFSQFAENVESKQIHKIEGNIEFISKNDSVEKIIEIFKTCMNKIVENFDFRISNIKELTNTDYIDKITTKKTSLDSDLIIEESKKYFFKKQKTLIEKMEFYHVMRLKGFDKDTLEFVIKNNI